MERRLGGVAQAEGGVAQRSNMCEDARRRKLRIITQRRRVGQHLVQGYFTTIQGHVDVVCRQEGTGQSGDHVEEVGTPILRVG